MQKIIDQLNNTTCENIDLKEVANILQKNQDIIDSQMRTIQALLQGVPHAENGSSAVILHIARLEYQIEEFIEQLSKKQKAMKEIKDVENSLRWCINAQLYHFKHHNEPEKAEGLHHFLQDTPMIQEIIEKYE